MQAAFKIERKKFTTISAARLLSSGFRQGVIQTSLLGYRGYLENEIFDQSKYNKQITKALI